MPLTPPAAVWAFAGTKGGTGTTLLSTSLAWALSEQGAQVIVIDLDFDSGAAALHLCERQAGPTVIDALGVIGRLDGTLLDTLLTPCAGGLRLLPAPRDSRHVGFGSVDTSPDAQASAIDTLIRTAAGMADFVFLDLPNTDAIPTPVAHLALVGEPTLSSTFHARRRLEALGASHLRLSHVLNKVDRRGTLEPADIRSALPGATLGWREMPRSDDAAQQALHRGLPVGAFKPRDPLAQALTQWAQDLAQTRATMEPGASPSWRDLLQRWAS